MLTSALFLYSLMVEKPKNAIAGNISAITSAIMLGTLSRMLNDELIEADAFAVSQQTSQEIVLEGECERTRIQVAAANQELATISQYRLASLLQGNSLPELPSVSAKGSFPSLPSAAPLNTEKSPYLPSLSEPELTLLTLDDLDFGNFQKSPHWMILAPTGFGKSALLAEIINRIDGDLIVTDPHAEPGDWKGLEIIGKGGREEEVDRMIDETLEEVRLRYTRRDRGDKSYPNLTNVIEEFPAIALVQVEDKDRKVVFKKWRQKNLLEARKVHIRNIYISQGKSVETLGIKGQSELLENLNIIRGGSFAITHAKSLGNEALYHWLLKQDRPATVNDCGLIIPEIEKLEDVGKINPRPELHPETQDLVRRIKGLGKNVKVDPRTDSTPRPSVIERLDLDKPKIESLQTPSGGLSEASLSSDASPVSLAVSHLSSTYGIETEVLKSAIAAYQEGTSKTKIIENILKLGGSNFSKGKEVYSVIEEYFTRGG